MVFLSFSISLFIRCDVIRFRLEIESPIRILRPFTTTSENAWLHIPKNWLMNIIIAISGRGWICKCHTLILSGEIIPWYHEHYTPFVITLGCENEEFSPRWLWLTQIYVIGPAWFHCIFQMLLAVIKPIQFDGPTTWLCGANADLKPIVAHELNTSDGDHSPLVFVCNKPRLWLK